MSRAGKLMAFMAGAWFVALGLGGCTRSPAGRGGQADRLRVLEARCARLEQDYRTVAEARDQARKQLDAALVENAQFRKEVEGRRADETEKDELRKQAETLQKTLAVRTAERDEARSDLAERTGERDAAQARCARMMEVVARQMQQMQSLMSDGNANGGSQAPAPASMAPAGEP